MAMRTAEEQAQRDTATLLKSRVAEDIVFDPNGTARNIRALVNRNPYGLDQDDDGDSINKRYEIQVSSAEENGIATPQLHLVFALEGEDWVVASITKGGPGEMHTLTIKQSEQQTTALRGLRRIQ